VALALALFGCSTSRVRTDYDHTLETAVGSFRTYAWITQQSLIPRTGTDPGLSPFDDARIRSAVEQVLAEKGYRRISDPRGADFLVVYTAQVDQVVVHDPVAGSNSVVFGFNGPVTGRIAPLMRARVRTQGRFTVQLVEPQGGALVWLGWGERILSPQIERSALFAQIFGQILQPLPARS
jgi:hypothetical protein